MSTKMTPGSASKLIESTRRRGGRAAVGPSREYRQSRESARRRDTARRAPQRLASPRDRARLDKRNSAERERVERALASVPIPIDPEEGFALRPSTVPLANPPMVQVFTPLACPVCGGTKIDCDEVFQLGALRIAECQRCDFFWTDRRTGRASGRWAEIGSTMKRVTRPVSARESVAGAR